MKKIRLGILLVSLVGAVAGIFLAEFLVNLLPNIPSIFRTGIYFTPPLFLAFAGAVIAETISPFAGRKKDKIFKLCVTVSTLIALLGSFGISALGQFMYELTWNAGAHNIAFLIDRSISMIGAPIEKASEAAEHIVPRLNQRDKAALIYFDDEAEIRLPLSDMTNDARSMFIETLQEDSNKVGGGTEFPTALNTAVGVIEDYGSNAAVFMITDGGGSISRYKIDDWTESGVRFYVINITSSVNEQLNELCEASGGQYVANDDPAAIDATMRSMYESHISKAAGRLLFRHRPNGSRPLWYCILISMLFYTLLGGLMSLAYMLLINIKSLLFVYNLAGGFVTGIAVEICNFIPDGKYFIIPVIIIAVILLICPAFVLGAGKRKNAHGDTKIDMDAYDEDYVPGRIIK